MKWLLLTGLNLMVLSTAWAQPSCVSLIKAWENATETALSYSDEVKVTQGGRELFYQLGQHSRDDAGELVREVLEERSALPFPVPGRPEDNEEDDDSPEEFCEGTTLSAEGDTWVIRAEGEEDSPVKDSSIVFEPYRDTFVPTLLQGRFEITILRIPLSGVFTTSFSDWEFPLSYVDPRDR